jgi:hypothetical protein
MIVLLARECSERAHRYEYPPVLVILPGVQTTAPVGGYACRKALTGFTVAAR